MRRNGEHGRAAPVCVVEPIDEVEVAGAARARTDRELAGDLRLARRREGRHLLMTRMDPDKGFLTPQRRRTAEGPRRRPAQPGGEDRYIVGCRRADLPRLRRHRAFRAALDRRAHQGRHRGRASARQEARPAAARYRQGPGRSQVGRGRPVTDEGRRPARSGTVDCLSRGGRGRAEPHGRVVPVSFALSVVQLTTIALPSSRRSWASLRYFSRSSFVAAPG